MVTSNCRTVYAGGFPSAGVTDLPSKVLRAMPADVPFLLGATSTSAVYASLDIWKKPFLVLRDRT
jgi:hypothetical protein